MHACNACNACNAWHTHTCKVVHAPLVTAPEMLVMDVQGYDGKAVDMWSVGIIMHVLLSGMYPFLAESAVFRGLTDELPAAVPKEAVGLLHAMLEIEPSSRISAEKASAHAWLQAAPAPNSPNGEQELIAAGSPATWLRARASGQLPAQVKVIHEAVLTELEGLGLSREAVIASVEGGLKDDFATSYFLLCHRRARQLEEADDEEDDEVDEATDITDKGGEAAAAGGVVLGARGLLLARVTVKRNVGVSEVHSPPCDAGMVLAGQGFNLLDMCLSVSV